MSSSEQGTFRYKTNERRVHDWGLHCVWPPKWVKISESARNFANQVPSELEEIYQGAFQRKVIEALEQLYGIETKALSLEKIVELSREHWFWIWDNGEVALPRRLWMGE